MVKQEMACREQAGSERVKDTKTSNGMLKEAGSINKSLFALGKVCTWQLGHASTLHAEGRSPENVRILLSSNAREQDMPEWHQTLRLAVAHVHITHACATLKTHEVCLSTQDCSLWMNRTKRLCTCQGLCLSA